jgi:hypothetical protein
MSRESCHPNDDGALEASRQQDGAARRENGFPLGRILS